jgi:hypothetical protein
MMTFGADLRYFPRMTDQADIFRAAKLMVERHGVVAPEECEAKAEELRRNGDEDGAAIWLLVARAAIQLLDDVRGPDSPVH